MADHDEQTPETPETEASQSGSDRRRGRSRSSNKPAAPDVKSLKFFTLVPSNPGIDFVGNRKKGLLLGLGLVMLSILAMVFNVVTTGSALNYGIDFQGGSSVRLELSSEPNIEQIRTVLEEAGYSGSSAVSVPDADNEVLIRVKEVLSISEDEVAACRDALAQLDGAQLLEDGFTHPKDSSKIFMKFSAQPKYDEIERLMTEAGCQGTAEAGVGKAEEFPVEYAMIGVGAQIAQVLDQELGAGTVENIVASETVGAKVGSQLRRDGVQAMLFAIFFIFLYVMLRFDLRFAPGGIVALAHDAMIVVGAYAITGKEFNLQTIAAILTVIGYSINDTIVVFDRVRERVALHRDEPIEATTNTALNETLSRTTLTSATTLLVVVATWVLGTGTIKDFAFALFVGIVAGTYSSLFLASPVFLWINDKMYKGKGHLIDGGDEKERGTGTLLGGEPEVEPEQAEEASVLGEETGEGPQASADVGAAIRGESAADKLLIEDVDKQATERKTRRRRRKKDE
ncbi:MAG TPA: protein translocase subunit SecF [Enhygromyxa sp.]|nr:protein translocase subunit SecF [Enhygromyxa sp.]